MKYFLSQLPKIVGQRKKRLGRGAGTGVGAKSGRGTTRHQGARESIPLHFEGGQGRMVKKFPLLRGKGKQNSVQVRPLIIKLAKLNIYQDNDTVDIDSLIKKNIIDKKAKKLGIKLIDASKLEKKLIIKNLKISEQAKKKIEELGGKVEL